MMALWASRMAMSASGGAIPSALVAPPRYVALMLSIVFSNSDNFCLHSTAEG
jgi:hypothetical protein